MKYVIHLLLILEYVLVGNIVVLRVLAGELFYLNILSLTKNVRLEILEVLEHTHSCCHVTQSTQTLFIVVYCCELKYFLWTSSQLFSHLSQLKYFPPVVTKM